MANSEIILLIIQTTADMFTYMLPIMGFLAGLNFIITFLYDFIFKSNRMR